MATRVGILLRNKGTNDILLAHATGRKPPFCWDIIKGHLEENEEPIEGLIREVREECGLDISNDSITFIGDYPYVKGDTLKVYYLEKGIPIDQLYCDSYFTDPYTGKQKPEMDEFLYFNFSKDDLEESYVYKTLKVVLKDAFSKLEVYE